MNVNKFYKTFDELSEFDEFKSTTIEHLVYIDGDQKPGLFKRNGLKLMRTHLAKHFLNEKYSNYLPASDTKEILKETTNKLNTSNGINASNGLLNGNLNGTTTNGGTTTTTLNNGTSNGALSNGAINGNASTVNCNLNGQHGKVSNENANLMIKDENEKPKNLKSLNSNQTTKKQRLQSENDDEPKVSVVDKMNIYVDSDSPCALFFTSVSYFIYRNSNLTKRIYRHCSLNNVLNFI